VASPSKIIAAPANYRAHVELDTLDPEVDAGFHRASLEGIDRPVDTYGLFLKASSSLVGPSEGITIDWPDPARRCDHEVELALVIGRAARNVRVEDALDYVAGYAIGLDITIRGSEDRSFRKSADSFSVLGPWLVTADELGDPSDIEFWLTVNEEPRQKSTTRAITVGLAELISIASRVYTLHPGDIIMTGTPEGVGRIEGGDIVRAGCEGIGEMELAVHRGAPR
jgi:2-keto-4-pentenoate hydratase/2-oxohepta-3-ene-1,7-dioic acid hydratase in catechol pathway